MKENPDMNTNDSNERIDELLNSYIDNELTAEQKAEVESLVDHNKKIAQRLRQFQKCRILVGSMPFAEAPASVLEGVKTSLAGRALPSEKQPASQGFGCRCHDWAGSSLIGSDSQVCASPDCSGRTPSPHGRCIGIQRQA